MTNLHAEVSPYESAFLAVIEKGTAAEIKSFVEDHPELKYTKWKGAYPWVNFAVTTRRIDAVTLLLESGFDPNQNEGPPAFGTALVNAFAQDSPDLVRILLEHGAIPDGDPRYVRYQLSAVTNTKHALEYIKLLEQHGCDLDRDFMHNGMKKLVNALSMAEMWDHDDVVKYLRAKGYRTPEEKTTGQKAPVAEEPVVAQVVPTLANEVIDYFAQTVGKAEPLSLQQIVPTGIPISVHAIPAAEDRPFVTLFTTGLSERPMTVPAGEEEFARAELYIQLPADWKYQEFADPVWGWPQHWLRSMAQYPAQHDTWLGGPATLVANEEPPRPLAPGTEFTTLLMIVDRSFTSREGHTISLYRLMPLYSEERQLELREGIAALMRAVDAASIPFVVDMHRKNVGR